MPKIKENLSLIIVFLTTIFYLWLSFHFFFDVKDFIQLELNAKGDFLAGVFAPLAFLWLVYGYYQQGKEIKQNTEALKSQEKVLEQNVEQQKKLLKAAHEELELVKAKDMRQARIETIQSQPFFHFNKYKIILSKSANNSENLEMYRVSFEFYNSRAICRKLDIFHDFIGDYANSIDEIDLIKNGEGNIYQVTTSLNPDFKVDGVDVFFKLSFRYLDSNDNSQIQKFGFSLRRVSETDDSLYWNHSNIYIVGETYKN